MLQVAFTHTFIQRLYTQRLYLTLSTLRPRGNMEFLILSEDTSECRLQVTAFWLEYNKFLLSHSRPLVSTILQQHSQQWVYVAQNIILKLKMTNLQMTFEFQIVSGDVVSLLALKLCLLQTVLQCPQVLRKHTHKTFQISPDWTHLSTGRNNNSILMFCTSPHEFEAKHHGIFLLLPGASIRGLCSTAALRLQSLLIPPQLFQALLVGLGCVFQGIETLLLRQHALVYCCHSGLRKRQ